MYFLSSVNAIMKRMQDDNVNADSAKKPKQHQQEENCMEILSPLLKNLSKDENVTAALKEFIKHTEGENAVEFVTCYLNLSPDCKEIFSLFGNNGRPNPDILQLIWGAFEGILSVTSQQKDDRFLYSSGNLITNKLFENHNKAIYSSFSTNCKDSLIRSVLKCMTFMIAQSKQSIKDLLANFDFGHRGFKAAAKKRDKRQQPDVRTCFVRFCLSFFVFGDMNTIVRLLEEKGFGALLLCDLHQDTAETILVVLETLKEKIVNNEGILKRTKLLFFSATVLSKLSLLAKKSEEEIRISVMDLLRIISTDAKKGIMFYPKDDFHTDKLMNVVLMKFLQFIRHSLVPQSSLMELAVDILRRSPDIIVPYINGIHMSLEPRNSVAYISDLRFLNEIWKSILLVSEIRLDVNADKNSEFLLKLVIPNILNKAQLTAALKYKHEQIQVLAFELLQTILIRCIDFMKLIARHSTTEKHRSYNRRLKFIDLITQSLPDVKNVIMVRQNILSKSKVKEGVDSDDGEQEDDHEMQVNAAEKTTVDVSSSTVTDDVSENSLLLLCMNTLWLYQTLKPGVLTESGFNICKLFLMDNVSAEVLEKVFDILILEEGGYGTRSWLEKKMPGGKNIIQLVLETMVEFHANDNIVEKGKQVFFKVLSMVEECHMFAHELHMWIDQLISLTAKHLIDDVKMTCKKFADSCLRYVNNPYTIHQHKLLLLQEQGSESPVESPPPLSSQRDFSPLLITILQRFTKTDFSQVDKEFMTSSLLRMFAYQTMISPLLCVLWKETGQYRDLFIPVYSFAGTLMESLDEEIGDDDMKTFLEPYSNAKEDDSDGTDGTGVFSLVAAILKLPRDSKRNRIKKTLREMCALDVTSNVNKLQNKLVCVKTLRNVLKALCKIKSISECAETLQQFLNIVLKLFKLVIAKDEPNSLTLNKTDAVEATCHYQRVCGVMLSIFDDFYHVNDDMWRRFGDAIAMLVFERQSGLKCTPETENTVHNIVKDLNEERCDLLCQLVRYFPQDLSHAVLKTVIGVLDDSESIKHSWPSLGTIFEELRKKALPLDECKVALQNLELKKMFLSSIKSGNAQEMRLFHSVYALYPSNELIDALTYKQFSKLFMCTTSATSSVFQDVAILLLKSNEKLCDVFVQGMLACDFERDAQLIERVAPLLLTIFLVTSDNEMTDGNFSTKIWRAILSLKRLSGDVISLLDRISAMITVTMITDDLSSLIPMATTSNSSDDYDTIKQRLLLLKKFLGKVGAEWKYEIEAAYHVMKMVFKKDTNVKQLYIDFLSDAFTMIDESVQVETAEGSLRSLMSSWKEFAVHILKDHFTNGSCMKMLSIATRKLYACEEFRENSGLILKDFYDMVVGHSNFLNVFIDEENVMKDEKDGLVCLLHSIIEMSPSCCNAAFLPVILMAYDASLSKTDRLLLSMMRTFDQDGTMLSQMFPFFWGKTAIEEYKTKQNEASKAFLRDASSELLSMLDFALITRTSYEFPVNLKFHGNELPVTSDTSDGDELYDPRFLLLLFVTCFQPGQHVNCKQFFESGGLLLTIVSLTSHDDDIRKMAYFVLTQYSNLLDSSRFREKSQVVYLLILLKNSISEENLRLQSVWGAYLCRYVSVLQRPDHSMYPVLNHQLLRKPTLSLWEIPVFLHFLHSSSTEHHNERFWVLKLLLNGLKDQSGYYLYKRKHVFELVMCCHDSSVSDKKCKPIVIDLLMSACNMFHATFDLVKIYSITSWIGFWITRTKGAERSKFIQLLHTIKNTFKKGKPHTERSKDHDQQQQPTTTISTPTSATTTSEEKKAAFPRCFPNEALIVCLRCMRDVTNLSKSDLLQVCSIVAWIFSQSNDHHGDACAWIQGSDCVCLLKSFNTLFIQYDNLKDVSTMFHDVVMELMEKRAEIVLPLLSRNLSWQEIYVIACNNKLTETKELFTKLQRWRTTSKEKSFFQTLLRCASNASKL